MNKWSFPFKFLVMLLITAVVSSLSAKAEHQDLRIDVTTLGARADTNVHSTTAIQQAIDSCYHHGGGTVNIPPGSFKSGTLVLKDHVTLHLEAGATLYASRDIEQYKMPLENATRPVFLYANGAQNISIQGKGTIHGNARHTYEDLKKTDRFIAEITANARAAGVEMKQFYIVKPDVALVILSDCQDISIEDVTLRESSFWTLHIIKSDRVAIRGIQVYSSLESGVNADGIDINSCSQVHISDCVVATGDDAIVLKTWHDKACEDIVVTNCVLSSSSTALKLGTESHGNFRRIEFSNCTIKNTNRGLSIVVRNGGHVEDVLFSNITMHCSRRHFNWWGNADPIWLVVLKKNKNTPLGSIKNVVFDNIQADGMGTSKIECEEAGHINNITIKNSRFHMRAENYPDKRADHAIYAKNTAGLTIKDVIISWHDSEREDKWGSALWAENCQGLWLDGLVARQGLIESDFPVVQLNNVKDATVTRCQATAGAKVLVTVSGEHSKNIRLEQNQLPQTSAVELRVAPSVKSTHTIVKIP